MNNYQQRKAERTVRFHADSGRKLITCCACAGSGRYDHNGSPKCGSCNGTGRVRESKPKPSVQPLPWREKLAQTAGIKIARRQLR